MKISVVSFTENGLLLSLRLAEQMGEGSLCIYTKCSQGKRAGGCEGIQNITESLSDWTGAQMAAKNGILFIGACGIAVRAIAPFVEDKRSDSPVLVMDEKGRYVIPILSGHLGGANELAEKIAVLLGAIPVITTATDLNDRLAIDLFAKKNYLTIVNKEGIAKVSAKILAGKQITMAIEPGHLDQPDEVPAQVTLVPYPPKGTVDVLIAEEMLPGQAILWLQPKLYAIGMGCKRGKEPEPVADFIAETLQARKIETSRVFALASIDKKKDEECFLLWSQREKLPFLTFSAEELQGAEGSFTHSDFVKKQVGVDNVCERAALLACKKGGVLLQKKCAKDGMTIAIARREWRVSFEE